MDITIKLDDFQEGLSETVSHVVQRVIEDNVYELIKSTVHKIITEWKNRRELNEMIDNFISDEYKILIGKEKDRLKKYFDEKHNETINNINSYAAEELKQFGEYEIDRIIDATVKKRVYHIINKSKPKVKITEDELLELKMRSAILQMLENGGVDNWSWYGESLKGLEESEKDIEQEVRTYEHVD